MTESEKAKAYDKAIKRADELLRVCSNGSIQRGLIEEFFPELAESEDERIRKELLSFVRGMLECHDKPDAERDEQYESWIAWLEKQSEQKFIIPKFRVGDTIHKVGENTIYPMTIERISKTSYICNDERDFVNIEMQDKFELVEQKLAEWSKEDEKMVSGLLSIVEDWYNSQSQEEKAYYGDCGYINWLKSLRPQPKQEWSEEDEGMLRDAIDAINATANGLSQVENSYEIIDWLNSLRPQKQWKPSDADISVLEGIVTGEYKPKDFQITLWSLIDNLKQLKGK